jgi:hypothetical protein
MINPKQGLTSFTRLYQAKDAAPRRRAPVFGPLAANLAAASAVRETDAANLSRLARDYSIHSIEELAALVRLDRKKGRNFMKKLGLPAEMPKRVLAALKKIGPQVLAEIERYEKLDYALGCDLDFSTPPPSANALQPATVMGITFGAPLPNAVPSPAELSLIDSHMPPIKDQADRGTCVAFTSVVCLEYHLSRFGQQPALDLSEQFQYWNMVTTTSQRNLVSAYPLLTGQGICREKTWPYYGKVIAGNETQGPVPANSAAEAAGFRCDQVRQVPPQDVAAIQDELRKGRLVGIGIAVYDSWFESGTVRQYGNITMPFPGEVPQTIGHAVTLVGYANDAEYAGGGYFIVRNSWDHYWGTQSVFGPGYGTIPYAYISKHNWDAWCIVS